MARKLVLEEIYNNLERNLIEVEVLGDREFIGDKWEEYIGKKFVNYTLRVRRDYEIKEGETVGDIIQEMVDGEVREIKRDGW